MTQNLDHDIDSSYDYNSTNTDVPSNWSDTLVSTRATNDTTWNGYSTVSESYDPGDLCWTGNPNTDWDGTLATETESCTQNGNHYHIGNYYNWAASVAMSNSSSYTTNYTDVDQSICPAGWMLPKGGWTLTGSGSFIYLLNEYGYSNYALSDYTAWGEPLRLTLGGVWEGDSSGVTSGGYFWSSVGAAGGSAYNLDVEADGGVYAPQYDGGRWYGSSVRCVAR
jgi:hypothetical protein